MRMRMGVRMGDEDNMGMEMEAEMVQSRVPEDEDDSKSSSSNEDEWRMCIFCAVYEPFEFITEDCCWQEYGRQCVFRRPCARSD